jgi:hypothetical protein
MLSSENLSLLQSLPKLEPEAPKPISEMEAMLEPVQTNEKFLAKLAKSKRTVMRQARSLKKFSYGIGAIAVLLSAGSLMAGMSLKI